MNKLKIGTVIKNKAHPEWEPYEVVEWEDWGYVLRCGDLLSDICFAEVRLWEVL